MPLSPDLIGYMLLQRPFKDWFLYMFKVIEGQPFVIDKIHNDMFKFFQDIIDGKEKRCVLSLPPRAGKTTLSKWFLIYGLTINPKANFIYCSYSQSLLNTIALEVQAVLENPIYKAMYPQNVARIENEEVNPIDDFWGDYLKKETGKNLYSNKKIITYAGGISLFSSIGASITGFGFSTRNPKRFSGALIIDDPQKMADIHSKVLKKKCLLYFEETLLSRANNPNAPIVCVQQRAAIDDLSGYLINKYKFYNLKKPLLDENGICQIETQYTPERIKELQINNYMFQAQYMQEPIVQGGQVIKREWFGYYNPTLPQTYKRIVIAGDTAMTVKEKSDYTCLLVGGVTPQGKLHILQMVHGKYEYPELKQTVINLYNQYKDGETKCSAIYIENKASGIQLIQDFKKVGLPIVGIDVTKDKLARVEEILEYLANGLVLLPESESYGNNPEFLAECEGFSRDFSHQHDDICLVGNTKIATLFGDKCIKDIKVGDYVITPYGLNKVIKSECTGEHITINNLGLTGTYNHKVFANGIFAKLGSLKYDVEVNTLSLKELIKWKYKKLLSSMVLNTDLWGRKGIIYLNQIPMKEDDTLKDFTLQFGNIIAEKQFLKAILFIIKTVIILITTFLIWSVYHVANICNYIGKIGLIMVKVLNPLNILQKLETLPKLGTLVKRVENGIDNTLKTLYQRLGLLENKEFVHIVGKNIRQKQQLKNIVVENVANNGENKNKVYNITVDKAQTYYANGILVSNCDTLTYIVNNTIANRKVSILEVL